MLDKEQKIILEAVLERLLLSKGLLSPLRYATVAQPDRQTLATHILTSHDAAELALAGIAQHLGKFPNQPQIYLMDLFPAIKQIHPDHEVEGKEFFNQLNRVRIGIKHHGVFPDPRQWYRVAEKTYDYISSWCKNYIGYFLDELDESSLIFDTEVRRLFLLAKDSFSKGAFREALEIIAQAELVLFESNSALRGLAVGIPKAEDAIKLSAFGVNANDFLALQEFLPEVIRQRDDSIQKIWRQAQYGHPANWRKDAVDFCLRTFLSMALRIQNALWIPGAIEFGHVYEYELTALKDGVELWLDKRVGLSGTTKDIVKTLKKGETLRGHVSRRRTDLFVELTGQEKEPSLLFASWDTKIIGYVLKADVSVKCVPIKSAFVEKYFPDLPEIEADV